MIPIVNAGAAGPAAAGAAAADADDQALMVSLYQKQAKIYPRSVSGVFARWRWTMVGITQAVFYGVPWLRWNGRQAVLFDLEAQRFYLFGLVLQPQDLIFLAALLVIAALTLFAVTAVAGRLWCGYACPQTVYTEMFLWIERRTEGDRVARMRLDKAPWGAEKLLRKGGKHLGWGLLALLTGFTFVGWFTPIRPLLGHALAASLGPWEVFWVLFYALATYGNAGWMREQICKYMCPYARFQSTLIDADSLVIAYDTRRGEPRGARSRKAEPSKLGLGSCIDCKMCVQVCPTGIDIRNGLQNECIGCAACIDVCDDVMGKMRYPSGLIRYATANSLARGDERTQLFARMRRPRVMVYAALLLAALSAVAVGLTQRAPVAMNIIRDRGVLARQVESGDIENLYRVQLMNRSESNAQWQVRAEGLPGLTIDGESAVKLQPNEVHAATVRVLLPQAALSGLAPGPHPITLALSRPGEAEPVLREKTTFIVPR